MKKVLKVLSASMLSAIVAVSAASVVSAAGLNDYEESVLASLSEPIVLDDGTELAIPDAKYNQAVNYFNQDDVDLDEEQAETILAAIEDGKNYIVETGVTSLGELTVDDISELAAIAQAAADEAGLEVTVSADGAVDIGGTTVNPDEPVVPTTDDKTTATPAATTTSNDGVIKTTGFDVPSVAGVAGVGILMVSAAGIYLAKASKKESVDA